MSARHKRTKFLVLTHMPFLIDLASKTFYYFEEPVCFVCSIMDFGPGLALTSAVFVRSVADGL